MQEESIFWRKIDQYRTGSLKELCCKAGLSYASLRSKRSKRREPTLREAAALAEAISVPLELLISEDAEPYKIAVMALKASNADELDICLIERLFGPRDLPFSASCAR